MPREKEMYRENLERVMEYWPTQEMVRMKDVAMWLGVDIRTLQRDKTFPAKKIGGRYFVSVTALASWMS